MARIGWVACGLCGNPESSVSENAAGTLSVSCHKCQYSGYAKAGSKAARLVRAAMQADEDAVQTKPAPIRPAADEPPPKVQPKTANSVFSLANL